jgi:endonuclease-3 related protein
VYRELLDTLLEQHGPQQWWPADDRFEIMVGAILVQRTAWRNAVLAIDALKRADVLLPDKLARVELDSLAALIRPAGFFRVKAHRLQRLAQFIVAAGGVTALDRQPTAVLRASLLEIHGIGPETADSILGYGFERPAFVNDAYSRRVIARLRHPVPAPSDTDLQSDCERELTRATDLNELHALIVKHGQVHCRVVALCEGCSLQSRCGYSHERLLAESHLD